MKLVAFTLYRYRLPLRPPLMLRGAPMSWRDGWIVELESDARVKGWGDIAPLPGFSRETMAQAGEQVESLAAAALGHAMDAQGIWSIAYARGRRLAPSAAFGFETAYLDALARASGLGLSAIVGEHAHAKVPVNALLTDLGGGAAESVQALAKEGFRCFKGKVGRAAVREEAARVRELCAALPVGATLRLDANRAWPLADAVWFAQQVHAPCIEYLEEPVADPEDLHEYCGEAPVRAALDETLVERGARALEAFDGVGAAVLKPTLLGGVVRSLDLAQRAWDLGITPTLSAAFESSVGLTALAHLAAVAQAEGAAAGLDTGRWLGKDVLDPPLDISGGHVDLERLSRTLSFLRPEALEKVAHG